MIDIHNFKAKVIPLSEMPGVRLLEIASMPQDEKQSLAMIQLLKDALIDQTQTAEIDTLSMTVITDIIEAYFNATETEETFDMSFIEDADPNAKE